MILVDPTEFSFAASQKPPISDGLSETLHKENLLMENILSDNTLDDYSKLQKYQQAFQRLLTHSRMYRQKPIGHIEMKELSEKNINSEPILKTNSNEIKEQLLTKTPGYLKPKASALFDAIGTIPGVSFDSLNQLVIRDKPISGSNVITLISDLIRQRKTAAPIGWSELSDEMVANKLSSRLISNPKRKETLNNKGRGRTPKKMESIKRWDISP